MKIISIATLFALTLFNNNSALAVESDTTFTQQLNTLKHHYRPIVLQKGRLNL